MEPIGLAVGVVGLAGLFSVCVDVIDKVDSYKDFGFESRAIVAQFKADKHLFIRWAQAVGIDNKNPLQDKCHPLLDDWETRSIVQDLLSSVQEIFSRTDDTMFNLQLVVDAGPSSFPDGIRFPNLNTRQKTQKREAAFSKRNRIGWSLRSKTKFINQVHQFGDLVQRLQTLVPPNEQTKAGTANNENREALFSNSRQLYVDLERQIDCKAASRYEVSLTIQDDTRKYLNIWLDASWSREFYDIVTRKRLDGTCDWILTRQAFLDWISPVFPSESAKILWINGPAGHGKTILCAKIIQHLLSIHDAPLAYHFCSSESETRRNSLSIIRSWISQIVSCSQDAFDLALTRWETTDGGNASQTDVVELFKSIVQLVPNCAFVVDGLDECSWAKETWKTSNDNSPEGFFESITHAVANTPTRILILSREEPELRHGLAAALAGDHDRSLTEYKLRPDDVRSDAMLLSRSIVDKRLANKSEILKSELSQKIADRCGGMFLWMKMLEEQLRSGKNKKQLEETIDQTPTALEHFYDRNWEKILSLPEKDKTRALSILRWTAFALRPLTIAEMAEALVVDMDCDSLLVDQLPDAIDEDYVNDEILGLCGSFLETQGATSNQNLESRTLHLAHFSIKQYIISNMPAHGSVLMVNEQLRASNQVYQSNILAQLCLQYLNFGGIWQEPLQLPDGHVKRHLLDYASGSWYNHSSGHGANYKAVVALINALFSSNGNWKSWKTWFDINKEKESVRQIDSTNPLRYTSRLGLRDTVTYLLEKEHLDVNRVDADNGTAIQAAAVWGQAAIVELLLDNGADANIADNQGWTPLIMASEYGYVEVVKLLLKNGADSTIADNEGCTPLARAAGQGHVEIVKILRENRDEIMVVTRDGRTPLYMASASGHVKVVKFLLENGADVTTPDKDGWTPLNSASDSGHVEVVKLLLEHKADVTARSSYGWTPLNCASDYGYVEVVKLLLEHKADVTVITSNGDTPLILAAKNGHESVVSMLLEYDPRPWLKNLLGRTSMWWASRYGAVGLIELLLKIDDVDVDSQDYYGTTPLSIAAKMGNKDTVELLLSRSLCVDVKDHFGRTPLWWAKRMGYPDIANILLKKYHESGISCPEYSDFEVDRPSIQMSPRIVVRYCDVCTGDVSGTETYHNCTVCCAGSFDICKECFEIDAHCLDESHRLVAMIDGKVIVEGK